MDPVFFITLRYFKCLSVTKDKTIQMKKIPREKLSMSTNYLFIELSLFSPLRLILMSHCVTSHLQLDWWAALSKYVFGNPIQMRIVHIIIAFPKSINSNKWIRPLFTRSLKLLSEKFLEWATVQIIKKFKTLNFIQIDFPDYAWNSLVQ